MLIVDIKRVDIYLLLFEMFLFLNVLIIWCSLMTQQTLSTVCNSDVKQDFFSPRSIENPKKRNVSKIELKLTMYLLIKPTILYYQGRTTLIVVHHYLFV